MRTITLVAAAALALVFAGCSKTEQAATKTEPAVNEVKKEEPKAEVKKEEPKAEVKKDEAKKEEPAAAGAGSPEENCGALYDFTKQLMEAFTKKMGPAAKTQGKELPPRDKFIEACKELPPEVSRCMNPQVAMKEAAKCQEVLKNADKSKIDKFKKLLGGK